MYNYFFTTYTEEVALSPKQPYIAEENQIAPYKSIWQTANTKNHAVLPYKATSVNGTPLAAPQRSAPAQASQAALEGLSLASQQIKEVTGIFDASLGAAGNETSGKAIIARQNQGDTANYHFTANAAVALKYLGEIILDLIPIVIDTPRAVRILGEDMTDKVVRVNEAYGEEGKLFDLTVGQYDVITTVGPSYETKRIETLETIVSALPQIPLIGQIGGDLIMRMFDNPLSSQLADRLKKQIGLTSPGIIEDNGADNKGGMSEQEIQQIVGDIQKLQQQTQMSEQQNKQLTGIIADLQKQLKDKNAELSVKMHDIDTKANTEKLKATTEIQKENIRQHHNVANSIIDNALKFSGAGRPDPSYNPSNPPAGQAESDNERTDV
jgi:hypothetical protein